MNVVVTIAMVLLAESVNENLLAHVTASCAELGLLAASVKKTFANWVAANCVELGLLVAKNVNETFVVSANETFVASVNEPFEVSANETFVAASLLAETSVKDALTDSERTKEPQVTRQLRLH